MHIPPASESENAAPEVTSLSYKFQRLREKLRQAVSTGELTGKLPGERALAKRFHVNAKTLSKALTDLAAEGLLDRSIGRGTFVKGSAPAVIAAKRWLVLCDVDDAAGDTVAMLRRGHSDLEIATDLTTIRPSFINQFSAVVDLASRTRDALIRDLVVRNVPVVVVGEKPYTYSTHAVQCDYALAISMLGRDLVLGGHRRLAAVEPRNSAMVADHLRSAAARYAPQTTVDSCFPEDAAAMVEHGVTAFVCGSCETASAVKSQLDRSNISVPGQISLMAIGATSCDPPCSGYFIPPEEIAAAIIQLLGDSMSSRPTTIWLAGRFVDGHTMAPIAALAEEPAMHYRDLAG